MTRHTSHHNKNEDGRSPEIEGYIDETIKWILSQYPNDNGIKSIVDLGCDYGYMLYQFKLAGAVNLLGVDTHFTYNPFNLSIIRESMSNPLLWKYAKETKITFDFIDLIVLNHSLEHVSDPHVVLANVRNLTTGNTKVFIGLPHESSAWSTWDNHLSLWNQKFLIHFMKLHGFSPIKVELKCLRDNHIEIWGLFE